MVLACLWGVRPLSIGARFASRYQIVDRLGQGGMGDVYRARHLGLQKDVALKVLGAEPGGASELRFEREARTTARLDHPGCVRILDYGTAEGRQFIAMELIEGTTLAAVLRDAGALSSERALRIARGILSALAHAHGRGVVHRDVKPENVMVTPAGRCVVIDFGLARLGDEARLTATGTCLGSPHYVAPERLRDGTCDERADLYAIGVILYEMLAGTRPFPGTTPNEIVRNVLDRPARPLRAIRRDVPRALEAVIVRALAKDPARRFPDAEAMLGALDDIPYVEQLAAEAAHGAEDEASATTAIEELALAPPSRLRRMWSWVRYGGWRWHHSAA
jgi:serine/threonine-protein kinase